MLSGQTEFHGNLPFMKIQNRIIRGWSTVEGLGKKISALMFQLWYLTAHFQQYLSTFPRWKKNEGLWESIVATNRFPI